VKARGHFRKLKREKRRGRARVTIREEGEKVKKRTGGRLRSYSQISLNNSRFHAVSSLCLFAHQLSV
jgi:hypothetical protein